MTRVRAYPAHMSVRYDIREDDAGWSVYDVWTGETVVIELEVKSGLDIQDADDLADKLNFLADHGRREVRQ
jgi:hypothetical protein